MRQDRRQTPRKPPASLRAASLVCALVTNKEPVLKKMEDEDQHLMLSSDPHMHTVPCEHTDICREKEERERERERERESCLL